MSNSKSKKILSFVLTLLMLIGMLPMGIVSTSATESQINFDTVLPTSGTLATGNYYISNDTTLLGDLTLASGAVVNISLNGHVLDLDGHKIFSIGTSENKNTLNIYGGEKTNSHYLKKNATSGKYEILSSAGEDTITTNGGTIINGRSGSVIGNYGALQLTYTNGQMTDITFIGNYSQNEGGVFYCKYGEYSISNCEFYDNISQADGGAFSIGNSTFVFTNCKFKNNLAKYGGAITTGHYTSVRIIDCEITDNHTTDSFSYDNCDIFCYFGQLILGGTTKIDSVYIEFPEDPYPAGTERILVDTDKPLAQGASIGILREGTEGDISGKLDADYSQYFTLLNNDAGTYRLGDIETGDSPTKHILTIGTPYDVTANTAENGTVTVNKPKALAGERVTITLTPESTDYEDKTTSVTYVDGTEKSVQVADDKSFVMPAFNVSINATFGKTDTKLLEEYKDEKLPDLDDLGEDLNDIIKDAKDIIDAIEIGAEYTTLADAKEAVDNTITTATNSLQEARENALDTYKAEKISDLDDLGEDMNDIIKDAKDIIDAIEIGADYTTLADAKDAVADAVTTATTSLQQARENAFDTFKTEKLQELKALGKDYRNILSNACEQLENMTYDDQKSYEDNKAAVKTIFDNAKKNHATLKAKVCPVCSEIHTNVLEKTLCRVFYSTHLVRIVSKIVRAFF